MKLARVVLRLGIILAVLGSVMGVIGVSLIGTSVYLNVFGSTAAGNNAVLSNPIQFQNQTDDTFVEGRHRRAVPTLTPTPQRNRITTPSPVTTMVNPTPTEDMTSPDESLFAESEQDSSDTVEVESEQFVLTETITIPNTETLNDPSERPAVTNTMTISGSDKSNDGNPESVMQAEEDVHYVEPYTSTAQVQPPPSANSKLEPAATSVCPPTSEAVFDLIPIEGRPMASHPDFMHADLNLALRGFTPVSETLKLKFYNGNTDPNAPQLTGLFEPNRVSQISSVYQVNDWNWEAGECGGNPRGCRGEAVAESWPVTMIGLTTIPGEPIYTPERGPKIYSDGYVNLVLYAEAKRITLSYTRRDSVVAGYVVHLDNLCVDPNLVALYRSQISAAGWRMSGLLPALRNNQALGIARDDEIRVAVRDAGRFMDPRSQKDWWGQ